MLHRRGPIEPALVLVTTALAMIAFLGSSGCRDIVAPLQSDAVRFDPPPVYQRWWALTESCAGRSGDMAAYAWYSARQPLIAGDSAVTAYTDVTAHRIVLATAQRTSGSVVRHEMLHALLGPAYTGSDAHPPEYFRARCAGVVYCDATACASARPVPISAPPDAPTLPVSSLGVGIDLLGNPTTRTGADSVLSIVLRVKNPTAHPAWVSLQSTPDVAAPYVPWFGFRLTPVGRDSAVLVDVTSDTTRLPLGAGETRQLIVDVNTAHLAAGDYVIQGHFNVRQVAGALRIEP